MQPIHIKKHASWLIIITTSLCFLLQLGQNQCRNMDAGAFFCVSTSNFPWLPNPMISQSVIVAFSRLGKWTSPGCGSVTGIFTLRDKLRFWHCAIRRAAQVFLQPAVYRRLPPPLGRDSLFMHRAARPICWLWGHVMHALLARQHLGCFSMSISSLSAWTGVFFEPICHGLWSVSGCDEAAYLSVLTRRANVVDVTFDVLPKSPPESFIL